MSLNPSLKIRELVGRILRGILTHAVGMGYTPVKKRAFSFRFAIPFGLLLTLLLPGCRVDIGEGDADWHRLTSDKSRYLDAGGSRIHYMDMGGSGPAVLMIHGFADSTYCWHKNVGPLTDHGFRVVLVDQPGLGDSDIPPKGYVFSVAAQASAALKVADALNLDSFHIVGSSMGGGISLYLCLHHPERVRKAVLISPACYERRIRALGKLLALPGVSRVVSVFAGRWTVELALKDVYFDDSKVDDVLVDGYARFLNKTGYTNVLASISADYFSEEFRDMTQRYGEITSEVLIIWGEGDKWLPVDFGRRLNGRILGSELQVLEECGHLPHQEKPDTVNSMMTDFLK
jgi:pimeloyl-ACP methyl ester carboxylesterase